MPIDPKSTALLLIEYQNDFTTGGGVLHEGVEGVMESTNMLAHSVQVANQARAAGVSVMFAPISFAKGYREITADPHDILKGVVDEIVDAVNRRDVGSSPTVPQIKWRVIQRIYE
jgi:nicotinamidase-related amidase